MSSRELERVGVMGRVDSGALQLKDAAAMLELSYRQVKRLWRRYRQVGGKGLRHGSNFSLTPSVLRLNSSRPAVLP
jgi:transposase